MAETFDLASACGVRVSQHRVDVADQGCCG
jgi:hypothetical protein